MHAGGGKNHWNAGTGNRCPVPGIAWHIELGGTTLANGTANGSTEVPLDDPRLDSIPVETPDKLFLVISAAGEHSCDTTMVDFKVIEQL